MNSTVPDNASIDSPQPAIQNNSTHTSSTPVHSTQIQNSDEKTCPLKCIPENKKNLDDAENISNIQSTLPKTHLPPKNSQETVSVNTKLHINTSKPSSKNETTKSIDLSSLSTALENENNKEEKPIAASIISTDEKLKSNSVKKQQITTTSTSNCIYLIKIYLEIKIIKFF